MDGNILLAIALFFSLYALTRTKSSKYCLYTILTTSRNDAHIVWHILSKHGLEGQICMDDTVRISIEDASYKDVLLLHKYMELLVAPREVVNSGLLEKRPEQDCEG